MSKLKISKVAAKVTLVCVSVITGIVVFFKIKKIKESEKESLDDNFEDFDFDSLESNEHGREYVSITINSPGTSLEDADD